MVVSTFSSPPSTGVSTMSVFLDGLGLFLPFLLRRFFFFFFPEEEFLVDCDCTVSVFLVLPSNERSVIPTVLESSWELSLGSVL